MSRNTTAKKLLALSLSHSVANYRVIFASAFLKANLQRGSESEEQIEQKSPSQRDKKKKDNPTRSYLPTLLMKHVLPWVLDLSSYY